MVLLQEIVEDGITHASPTTSHSTQSLFGSEITKQDQDPNSPISVPIPPRSDIQLGYSNSNPASTSIESGQENETLVTSSEVEATTESPEDPHLKSSRIKSRLKRFPDRISRLPSRVRGKLSKHSSQSTTGTFTCFPRLPAELRLKIWSFTHPGPRTIRASNFRQRNSARGAREIMHWLWAPFIQPVALNVCKESRLYALETYKPFFANAFSHKVIYFDPQKDQLSFPLFDSPTTTFSSFCKNIAAEDMAAVKFLRLPLDTIYYWYAYIVRKFPQADNFFPFALHFCNLEEMVLVIDDDNGSSGPNLDDVLSDAWSWGGDPPTYRDIENLIIDDFRKQRQGNENLAAGKDLVVKFIYEWDPFHDVSHRTHAKLMMLDNPWSYPRDDWRVRLGLLRTKIQKKAAGITIPKLVNIQVEGTTPLDSTVVFYLELIPLYRLR